MVDEKLDKSLWLILEADPENREEIIGFLREIPEELLKDIRGVFLSGNIEEIFEEDENNMVLFGNNVAAEDGTTYKYEIDYNGQEKTLQIERSLSDMTGYGIPHMKFSATLTLSWEDLGTVESGDEIFVGNFENTMIQFGDWGNNSSFLGRGVIPCFVKEDDVITDKGKMRVIETEYDLIFGNSGCSVRKTMINSMETVDVSIDLAQMPDVITMDYIKGRYCGGVKKKELISPKDGNL